MLKLIAKTTFMLALVFLSMRFAAQAQETRQIVNCDDPDTWSTQSDMNLCSAALYGKADDELNDVWLEVRVTLQELDESLTRHEINESYGSAWDNMLKAQRAWIDYRDGHCRAESAHATGGSIYPLLFNSCRENLTRLRIEELQAVLELMRPM